jgi:glycosyltransferase involved in cell wall biosynthesis
MRILFITRKFPPTTGGMEKAAYCLSQGLSKIAEVKLLKWGGSNRWLPLVLPRLLLSSLWILTLRKADVIYLQDGLLAPLGCVLRVFRKPVAITIHGLDITYKNRFYQFLVPKCVGALSRAICVSGATKLEVLRRGIPEGKTAVIPNGVADELYMGLKGPERRSLREELSHRIGRDLMEKKLLLSVGRLVERKGIHWFVEEVMPQIIAQERDCLYLIAGDGVYRGEIQRAIEGSGTGNHVSLLGRVDDETLRHLYNVSDICLMPNIPVEGDMEGFGLVLLEAALCGLPVVASRLGGITEAIQDGKNGFLIDSSDVQGFVDVIMRLLADEEQRESFGARARQFCLENYLWEGVARRYLAEFQRLRR